MLSASLAAIAATFLLTTAAGSNGGEDAPPRVPTAIDMILVDAVVTDRQGRPVTGLGPSDFRLQEDGVPQTIVRFEAVDVGEASLPPAPAGAPSGSAAARSSTNLDRAGRPPRTFVVVFDDVHLGALDAVAAKEAVVRFLAQGTQPGDRVSLVVPGTALRWTVSMPEGREQLVQILGSLEGRRPAHPEMISDYEALRIVEDNDHEMADLVRQRFQVAGTLPDDDLMVAANSQGGRSLEDIHEDQGQFVQAEAIASRHGPAAEASSPGGRGVHPRRARRRAGPQVGSPGLGGLRARARRAAVPRRDRRLAPRERRRLLPRRAPAGHRRRSRRARFRGTVGRRALDASRGDSGGRSGRRGDGWLHGAQHERPRGRAGPDRPRVRELLPHRLLVDQLAARRQVPPHQRRGRSRGHRGPGAPGLLRVVG